MWLDATLAYLHFLAIFTLVSLLAVELLLIRGALDLRGIRLLGRIDQMYFGSAMIVLGTGIARLVWGAKGAEFYLSAWPFYVKLGLFIAVALVSIQPTLAFIRWRRMAERDAAWTVPDAERRGVKRLLLAQVHLAAMIPVFAVIMARGLGWR